MISLLSALSSPISKAAFSAIKNIPYSQLNMSKLDTILTLPPSKVHLASMIEEKLSQICPNLEESKRSFE